MNETKVKCVAWVKMRGHGVYGESRCTRDATHGKLCTQHYNAKQRLLGRTTPTSTKE
jgi:hypothetical protein